MNWLAHLYLAERTPESWLGNLLPDFMRGPALAAMPESYQPGIVQHRWIDAYTDAHPVFLRSVGRIEPGWRRFGGVLVDVYYDHLLAIAWSQYSSEPLETFIAMVYDALEGQLHRLNARARQRIEWMIANDLLGSYREPEGVERALAGLGTRLRHPVDLASALPAMLAEREAFAADFEEFFRALRARLAAGAARPQ